MFSPDREGKAIARQVLTLSGSHPIVDSFGASVSGLEYQLPLLVLFAPSRAL